MLADAGSIPAASTNTPLQPRGCRGSFPPPSVKRVPFTKRELGTCCYVHSGTIRPRDTATGRMRLSLSAVPGRFRAHE